MVRFWLGWFGMGKVGYNRMGRGGLGWVVEFGMQWHEKVRGGMGRDRMEWDWMGRDRTGWDGVGWDEMRCDVICSYAM